MAGSANADDGAGWRVGGDSAIVVGGSRVVVSWQCGCLLDGYLWLGRERQMAAQLRRQRVTRQRVTRRQ